ncbi:MAG: hypothetical protein HKN37_02445 [Rhodothermales bacterium]|nr:hypothetical protein [Rhodothermales bacterium]
MRGYTRTGALVLSVTFALCATVDSSAQGRKNAVVIEITKIEDSCRYQVQDIEREVLVGEQDTFFVSAGAFLNLVATGTAARVKIQDDARKNVKGFTNRGISLLRAGDSEFLRVRAARQNDPGSFHDISIDCCESLDEDGKCVNPAPSDKMSALDLRRERINRASLVAPLLKVWRSLFEEDGVDSPPVGGGGPGMDVDP